MNKEQQVMEAFRALYQKLAWLNRQTMEEALNVYKSSEVHFIEFIGNHENTNVTRLAEAFYMTTGAISKLSKKLIARGLVESYQHQDNRKEIYFRLTPAGQEVFRIHASLHESFQARDREVFREVTDPQYDSMLAFLGKYSRHLDEEIKKSGQAVSEDECSEDI